MVERIIQLPTSKSFFLFGARGTGKSTLVKKSFPISEGKTLYLDLLKEDVERQLLQRPQSLVEQIDRIGPSLEWIIIDEVQRAPRVLDVVHSLIEERKLKFALTGSSARKLKRGAANLLAGRALDFSLFPLTHREFGRKFDSIDLDHALAFGTLPGLLDIEGELKTKFLLSYAQMYLKEEIWGEQLIRKLEPFRQFLEIAAQADGKILNFSSLSRDLNVDDKTVRGYFEILNDTLIGWLLPSFSKSIRKQQRQAPKFYFFDNGVRRALDRTVVAPLRPSTYEYGKCFENFVINEIQRLSSYKGKAYSLSYFNTKEGVEIDLIIDRPGQPLALVEIKSKRLISDLDLSSLIKLRGEFGGAECFCLSLDDIPKKIEGINVLPWEIGLVELGLT